MPKPVSEAYPFLTGGGALAECIAAFDWGATALGPLDTWPMSRKTAVSLILQTQVPIVTLWGEDGFMIYNDAYSAFAGDRHPKLLGSKVREGWPEVAEFNDNIMKVGLAGQTLAYREFPLTLYLRDGQPEQVWLDLDYSPLREDDGTPVGVMAVVVDITTKVRARRELHAEREGLERMFEQAPGFVAVLRGPEHRFVMANEAYRSLVGYRDVAGKTVAEALPEVIGQGFVGLLDRAYTTGVPYVGRGVPVNLAHQPGSGLEERFLDFVFQPILSEERKATGIFVQGYDVTEQFEIERAIRAESHKLQVLNRTGAAVAAELDIDRIAQIVIDAATDLVGADCGIFSYDALDNEADSRMLSTVSRTWGEGCEQIAMPSGTDIFALAFAGDGILRSGNILEDPRHETIASLYDTSKGRAVTSYMAVPVVSRSGKVIGGLFFSHGEPDRFLQEHEEILTGIAGQAATAMENARLIHAAERELAERRRAEAALQTLNATLEHRVIEEVEARSKVEEQLRQVQKMEAVGQLTGGIAHDFNNMLAVVISGLNLMQRRLARGDTDVTRFVDAAIDGANRAANLTQRLLAFSRQQPLAPEPLVINKLVAGMSELLSRTLGEHIEIQTVLAAGLWQIKADPAQLENTILNLAVNARDAMDEGGKLTIETQNAFVDEPYAKEYAVTPGQFVMLAVADTGEGMSQAVISKAFDPFFTTKEVGKGTGLGLSQVYGFVRQSGGHVKIYSEIGVGTTVKIYLPRHYAEVEEVEQAKPAAPVHRGMKSERILVVEDDDRVRALSVEALTELGYTVVEASGPRQAIRVLERDHDFALLFTDIVMPGISGRELADIARRMHAGIKVLYTTGYTRNAIVHNGILDVGTSLLTKPFSLEELASKVRKILDA